MPTVLITGANRGLGLEFARQYGADGWRVHACCRNPEEASELGTIAAARPDAVSVHRMEVTEAASVSTVAQNLSDQPIDILISNAGILGGRGWKLGQTDYGNWEETLMVNVLGATHVLESFVDHVTSSDLKKMATISSKLGSIELARATSNLAYRTSKAAVNMAVKCVADALADRGVVCVAVSPGWVQTDMGGANADLAPEESVGNMRTLFETLTPGHTGQFLNHDGTELPW
tara:strand:+ start:7426 stop:8121 length:696 start_codon:yes stop_codon:yes gene_type:complete